MRRVICNYCNAEAEFNITAGGFKRWTCLNCGAYVGAHEKSNAPLGTLANRELRLARQQVHFVFDQIWRRYKVPRSDAYFFLAAALGVPKKKAHIGRMDKPMCLAAVIEIQKALDIFKRSRREGREYVLNFKEEL